MSDANRYVIAQPCPDLFGADVRDGVHLMPWDGGYVTCDECGGSGVVIPRLAPIDVHGMFDGEFVGRRFPSGIVAVVNPRPIRPPVYTWSETGWLVVGYARTGRECDCACHRLRSNYPGLSHDVLGECKSDGSCIDGRIEDGTLTPLEGVWVEKNQTYYIHYNGRLPVPAPGAVVDVHDGTWQLLETVREDVTP